jgi:integrase/recombinase XerD
MKDSIGEISPLRQRMLEDMRLRKLAPHAQAGYVRAVRKLAPLPLTSSVRLRAWLARRLPSHLTGYGILSDDGQKSGNP